MKNEISPFSLAYRFYCSKIDDNTIIFAPRDEDVVVDFLNYFLEEPYYTSISECWENDYILDGILLTKDEENNWHLKVSFQCHPLIEFDMPKTQALIEALLKV